MTNTLETRRALRAAYRGTLEEQHRQLGLRALRDATRLATSYPSLAELRLDTARFHLPYALEFARRAA